MEYWRILVFQLSSATGKCILVLLGKEVDPFNRKEVKIVGQKVIYAGRNTKHCGEKE